jgi:hypothetical protein
MSQKKLKYKDWLENVELLKYLCCSVRNINEIETEIKISIAGSIYYHELGHLLKERHVTHSLGVGRYKVIIRTTITYGAES